MAFTSPQWPKNERELSIVFHEDTFCLVFSMLIAPGSRLVGFGPTLDVAAQPGNAKCERYYTPADDALTQAWEGVCWCNPPYGRDLGLWIAKAYESAQAGATVVCLLPVRTDTRWWQTYILSAEVRFVPGRLTFGGASNPAPFPSAVVIFRPR